MSDDYSEWVGRSETRRDVLEPARSDALRAALGDVTQSVPGALLPPLHHWLYFWDVRAPGGLGIDGHPARGGFLPPVALPRRMWAGGRVTFVAPLVLGEAVTRVSTILKVETKVGRSGTLVFVTVEHRTSGQAGEAIVEQQDLVYRDAAAPGSVAMPRGDAPAPEAAWRYQLAPDPVLLFRYSALTMNGHRIHYDLPYAVQEEAYPALVVHGPLQATLLAAHAEAGLGRALASFSYRGQTPAFTGVSLHVCGDPGEDGGASLFTAQGDARCMIATATA